VTIGLWGRAVHAADEGPVFRFSPPTRTVRVETTRTTQLLEVAGQVAPARETESVARVEIVRMPNGCRLLSKLVSGTSQGGNSAVGQALLDALKGVTVTYVIDLQGHVQSVEGLEAAAARVRRSVPAEMEPTLARSFAPGALLQAQKADWDRAVGDLVGRPASVGAVWVSRQQYGAPDGSLVDVHAATKVVGRVKMQEHDCLRLANTFSSNPEDLRSFLGASAEALLADLKPLGGSARIAGDSQYITDPATLIWYQATSKLKMETTVEIPGRGPAPAVITWIKQYRTKPVPPK